MRRTNFRTNIFNGRLWVTTIVEERLTDDFDWNTQSPQFEILFVLPVAKKIIVKSKESSVALTLGKL